MRKAIVKPVLFSTSQAAGDDVEKLLCWVAGTTHFRGVAPFVKSRLQQGRHPNIANANPNIANALDYLEQGQLLSNKIISIGLLRILLINIGP